MDYLNFELEIGPGKGRDYEVSVRSPAGEARQTMRFPYDTLELDSRLKDLQIALLRSGGNRRLIASPEERAVQDFGLDLFNSLIADEVRARYDVSQEIALQKDKGLRLIMRIKDPALAALPWEFLYDQRRAEYICLSRSTPIVRYPESPQPIQTLAVKPPLRVLGMAVSPVDLDPLDLDREKQRVKEATDRLSGLVSLTWLEKSTWQDLQEAMQRGPWHVFHFIGHGGFSRQSDEGQIALADDDGLTFQLSATKLARLLDRGPKLVVLNACEGARGGNTDVFSSTASILVRSGIPAVLAMQYEITDRAAIEFSRSFYRAMAQGMPLEAAVAEARKAISIAITNTVEWGTPVLYLRSVGGRLFDVSLQKEQINTLYAEAQKAMLVAEWSSAVAKLKAVLEHDPGYEDASSALRVAEEQEVKNREDPETVRPEFVTAEVAPHQSAHDQSWDGGLSAQPIEEAHELETRVPSSSAQAEPIEERAEIFAQPAQAAILSAAGATSILTPIRKKKWLIIGLGILLAGIMLGWWYLKTMKQPPSKNANAGARDSIHTFRSPRKLSDQKGGVWSVVFSPDGRMVAAGGADGTLRVWETTSWTLLLEKKVHNSDINAVAFSPDNRIIATGGSDRTIGLWNSADGSSLPLQTQSHRDKVYSVAFSPDGKLLASAGADGQINLWNMETRSLTNSRTQRNSQVWAVVFSPDGATLAAGFGKGNESGVRVWDVKTNKDLRTLASDWPVFSVAFSPKAEILAAGNAGGKIMEWKWMSGELVAVTSRQGKVKSIAFSSSGSLVSCGEDKQINIWNAGVLERNEQPPDQVLTGHSESVESAVFSPNGRVLISGGQDQTIVWQ